MPSGRTLAQRLVIWGIVMTWAVGGAVSIQGYRLIDRTVRREAEARLQDALRVARRLIQAELDHLPNGGEGIEIVTASESAHSPSLAALLHAAEVRGVGRGFVLLDRGLCLAAVRHDPATGALTLAIRPLRGENRLPDQIRDLVFGPRVDDGPPRATLTIFERDVRIATNVVTAFGERAVGTRASPEVAAQVLGQGISWNDRARVLDRWTIASYVPIRAVNGEVIGMLYAGLDEAPYTAEGRRNLALFLASIASLTLFVSVMVWWLARRVAQPLGVLTSAATALGAGAAKPIHVNRSDPREIRLLSETFNHMAEQISARTAELQASRERVQKALDDYLEVLGFVAHELKSPLAGARTQLTTIEDGYVGDVSEEMKRPLAALRRALDYGLEVAQSFNQLSRAEGEEFKARIIEIEDFATEIAQLAASDHETAAALRGMSISLEGEAKHVWGDPDLLRVVMNNLVGNAVKYGREGGIIRITLQHTANGHRIEVYNEGVGVAPEKFGGLFEKFYRVQDPATKAARGTGVGLYLVRRFIELQGGTVGVEGEYGAWITFWFHLPEPSHR